VSNDGTEGNRRLTASTAVVLLVLLAAEGATIVAIGPLLGAHIFIGMLLIPPVVLKLATTGYRFARYYSRSATYRRAGPPRLLLRLTAPLVVAATVALFGSGVALVTLDPRRGFALELHKASFVVWFGAMSVHVLGHLLRVPRLASADWRHRPGIPGSRLRRGIVAAVLLAGLTLALATLSSAHAWEHFRHLHGGG
jgi:hypothetical protein